VCRRIGRNEGTGKVRGRHRAHDTVTGGPMVETPSVEEGEFLAVSAPPRFAGPRGKPAVRLRSRLPRRDAAPGPR
jgi:hypothetical protein